MVYPFYVESYPKGRNSAIKGGCKRKDGNQKTYIYQREHGEIITAFTIEQWSEVNEKGERILTCNVFNRNGDLVAKEETVY